MIPAMFVFLDPKQEGKKHTMAIENQNRTAHFAAMTVVMLLGLLAATASAEPERRYVKTKQGERPKPIVAVDNVCAWPNLTVLPDGAIIATIFNQPSHGSMAGDVECWGSKDGGQTWQKRGTPAPHEPDTNRMNVAAGLAKNGDLLVLSSGWSNRYPPGKSGAPFRESILKPWVCRSSDGGRTWDIDKKSAPDKTPDGNPGVPFGDIIEGHDGGLRVAMYTRNRGYVYCSRDDGKTWAEPVVIDPGHKRHEPALIHLGSGNWLVAGRLDGLNLYAATDDGKTWKARGPVTGKQQHPGHFLRLADGRLLLSYGNRGGGGFVEVLVSNDDGKTWSKPLCVVDWQGDGGYPSSVQLPDGQVLTAYYARKIKGHDRYHMGVVVWSPEKSLGR